MLRRFARIEDTVPYLEWAITATAVEHLKHHFLFHAAAVGRDGRGIIMPAAPESGKSTLTAALLAAGFQYFSDEVGVIETTTLRLLPFPRSLNIRRGSLPTLSRMHPELASITPYRRLSDGSVWYLQAKAEWQPPAAAAIRYVLLPQFTPGASTSLTPIPRSAALNALMTQSFNLREHGATGMGSLVRMLQGVECYALTFGDARQAVAVMLELDELRTAAVES